MFSCESALWCVLYSFGVCVLFVLCLRYSRAITRYLFFNLDEYSSISPGSDHKRIGPSSQREMKIGRRHDKQPRGIFYSGKQLKIAMFEDARTEWTLANLTKLFKLETAEVRVRPTGERRP